MTILSMPLLALVFYGLITPLAILFRVLGHDPLNRNADPQCASYWHDTRVGNAKVKAKE